MENNSAQHTFRAEMSGSCETMSCDAPNTAIQACTTETVMCKRHQAAVLPQVKR